LPESRQGDVWLASPAIIAASAIAGYITTPDKIPAEPVINVSGEEKSGFQLDCQEIKKLLAAVNQKKVSLKNKK